MKTTIYAIDTMDGNQLCAGLPAHTARRTAQRIADERGEPVALYSSDGGESEAIEPTEIVVEIDSASGPRVIYGAQDAETVESCVPAGWAVDWSSAVDIAPSRTHLIRFSALLVEAP